MITEMSREAFYRRFIMVDIEGFARPEWNDLVRARLRERLHKLFDHALARASIEVPRPWRDAGDGMVLILDDSSVSTIRLLHPLVSVFADRLSHNNQMAPPTERLRVRLVVDAAEVIQDAFGHTGEGLNHAARLLNAQAGRMILRAVPEADVVLLVSDQFYQRIIKHASEEVDPTGYQRVLVEEKETRTLAWAYLPGVTPQPDLSGLPNAVLASSGHADQSFRVIKEQRRVPRTLRRWGVIALAPIVLAVAVTGSTIAWHRGLAAETPAKVITVYNKVTNGAADMREDKPAYLSTLTQNYCKMFGCNLPSTDMLSGAKINAVCQTPGARTTNGEDGSAEDDANPNLYESTLWYGIRWPDGRFGYISEVWIQARYRGGLGLPQCRHQN